MAKKETKLNVGKGGYTYTDEDKGVVPHPGGYEYTQKEWDEIRDRSSSTKPTTLKNEKYKPQPKKESKPTAEGEYGSVNSDKNSEAIGPNMGKVNKESSEKDVDLQEKARRSMGFGSYKQGGNVKKSCGGGKMASGGKISSASKRADGCAIRGKTKGRMV